MQLFLAGFLAEMMIQVSQKKGDYLISERTSSAVGNGQLKENKEKR